MAIRVRCTECKKKISIDEAFAGGVCRCPYCRALVLVSSEGIPGEVGGGAGQAGGRVERPEAPTAPAPAPSGTPVRATVEYDSVPLADPVRLQGILTVVLIGLMALMVAAIVLIAWRMLHPPGAPGVPGPPPPPPQQANPFLPPPGTGIGLGDMRLHPPVVYCLDAGSGMTDFLDYAVLMTRVSAESLGSDSRFNALICVEGGEGPKTWYRWALPEMSVADEPTRAAVGEMLMALRPAGATDILPALGAGIDAGAKEIVLLARKPLGETGAVTAPAIERDVQIHVVALGADAEAIESLSALAQATGGQFRAYPTSRLEEWVSSAASSR
jgi:DNA-directed RNA polymerase subunit RPC12/RpoP